MSFLILRFCTQDLSAVCGRYTVRKKISSEKLFDMFQVVGAPPLPPRYNIAPTQPVPAVRLNAEKGKRELAMLRWGLIPYWAKDPKIGYCTINARADTVAEKPVFRSAFRDRRCLLIADGFYEWQKTNGKKQPYLVGLQDGSPFAFAGLWEWWRNPEGEVIESCTIMTTDANDLVRPIHDRMPVILDPKDYDTWLDVDLEDPEKLQKLLRPYPDKAMKAYPVSTLVNDPKNENPECVAPLKTE